MTGSVGVRCLSATRPLNVSSKLQLTQALERWYHTVPLWKDDAFPHKHAYVVSELNHFLGLNMYNTYSLLNRWSLGEH